MNKTVDLSICCLQNVIVFHSPLISNQNFEKIIPYQRRNGKTLLFIWLYVQKKLYRIFENFVPHTTLSKIDISLNCCPVFTCATSRTLLVYTKKNRFLNFFFFFESTALLIFNLRGSLISEVFGIF